MDKRGLTERDICTNAAGPREGGGAPRGGQRHRIEGPIRGTAWAGLQVFVEYAYHHRHTRPIRRVRADEMRFWFGRAAALKHQALFAIAGEARLLALAA